MPEARILLPRLTARKSAGRSKWSRVLSPVLSAGSPRPRGPAQIVFVEIIYKVLLYNIKFFFKLFFFFFKLKTPSSRYIAQHRSTIVFASTLSASTFHCHVADCRRLQSRKSAHDLLSGGKHWPNEPPSSRLEFEGSYLHANRRGAALSWSDHQTIPPTRILFLSALCYYFMSFLLIIFWQMS